MGQVLQVAPVVSPPQNYLVKHLVTGESLHEENTRIEYFRVRVEWWVIVFGQRLDIVGQTMDGVAVLVSIRAHQAMVPALAQEVCPPAIALELTETCAACVLDGFPEALVHLVVSDVIKVILVGGCREDVRHWHTWGWMTEILEKLILVSNDSMSLSGL